MVVLGADPHRFPPLYGFFYNKHMFYDNKTFQVEIWKMVLTNVFLFQFPVIRCPINESDKKTGKGKSKKIPRTAYSGAPLEAPLAPRLGKGKTSLLRGLNFGATELKGAISSQKEREGYPASRGNIFAVV